MKRRIYERGHVTDENKDMKEKKKCRNLTYFWNFYFNFRNILIIVYYKIISFIKG